MKRVLVTGAAGQVGTELTASLRHALGQGAVLATDLRRPEPGHPGVAEGPFSTLDATDGKALAEAVRKHGADTVVHLAALLSAVGEKRPADAYRVNMKGLMAVLEVAREEALSIFVPSSIAVFGDGVPDGVPSQVAPQRPITMYGVTKVAGELLCEYYHRRFGVDARGLRYPGLVSYAAPPGGGTTDYAVEMLGAAARGEEYDCFLAPDTQLDMMYMPDAVRATLELMGADPDRLRHRNAYNVTAMQLTPAGLAAAIREQLDGFRVGYRVDPERQRIADSWPRRIDDSAARADWGWRPEYDLSSMVDDALHHLGSSAAQTVEARNDRGERN